jgi:hypothetical protein
MHEDDNQPAEPYLMMSCHKFYVHKPTLSQLGLQPLVSFGAACMRRDTACTDHMQGHPMQLRAHFLNNINIIHFLVLLCEL